MVSAFEETKDWLKRFCTSSDHKFMLAPQWMVINFSDENIACIVAEHWNDQEEEETKILERVKKEILLTASADLIPASCLSERSAQKEEIFRFYYQQPHQSLEKFLQGLLPQLKNRKDNVLPLKSIVYTYSTTFDPLGLSNPKEFDEFKITSINSERLLDGVLTNFFDDDSKRYLFLRLRAGVDNRYFALAQLFIERLSNRYREKLILHKHVVLIFHLSRRDALEGKPQPLSITYMKGWNQIMIDSLQEVNYVDLESIIHLSSSELCHQKYNLIRTQESLWEIITDAYLKLNFREYDPDTGGFQVIERVNTVVNLLTKNQKIKEIILEAVNSQTNTDKSWLIEVVTDKQLLASSKDLYQALEKFFTNRIKSSMLQVIYTLESSGGMSTLLALAEPSKDEARTSTLFKIWTDILRRKVSNRSILMQKNRLNPIKKIHNTQIPFAFEDVMDCFDRLHMSMGVQEYKGIMINLMKNPEENKYLDSKFQQLEQKRQKPW